MTSDTGQVHWDVVISAERPWWKIGLGEFWAYRDLIALMVRRDIVAMHKQTVLGPLWHFVTPLFTTLIFALMFGRVARLPTDGVPPVLFYLSGLIPWGFFGTTLTKTSHSFISQAHLLTKVYFPRLIVPLSITISNFVSFAIQLIMLFGFIAFYAMGTGEFAWSLSSNLLLLPVVVLMIGLLGLGVGIIVAAATIRFRDLNFLIGFGVQLLMYVSPVIFPPSMLQGKLGTVVGLNPMTPLINAFRAVVFGGPLDLSSLTYSLVVILAALFFGIIYYQRSERSFADVV